MAFAIQNWRLADYVHMKKNIQVQWSQTKELPRKNLTFGNIHQGDAEQEKQDCCL